LRAETTADTLELLSGCLRAFGAVETGRSAAELRVSLPVLLSDGRSLVYRLTITVTGCLVSAGETVPARLPAFCPERHINQDGSFCLYWRAVDEIVLDGPGAARDWWETLLRFLQMQARAARLRRWPDRRARAHGAAAIHQLRAELAAERLGEPYVSDLAVGRLSVIAKGRGTERSGVQLLRAGRRRYSVWVQPMRVVNLRRRCVCPAGSARRPAILRSCGDHADAAARLALELYEMEEQERRFWAAVKGSPCCGTIDGCPLARPADQGITSGQMPVVASRSTAR
jgi:hypothetical protein